MSIRKKSRKMIRFVEKNSRVSKFRVGFTPFEESPSDKHAVDGTQGEKRICAHELFSRFTADIINDHEVFVR